MCQKSGRSEYEFEYFPKSLIRITIKETFHVRAKASIVKKNISTVVGYVKESFSVTLLLITASTT